jgi:hypothetical protein
MIAQGLTISLHLGSSPDAVSAIVETYGGRIAAADVFIANDPYGSGDIHQPDIYVIQPVFVDDVLDVFACDPLERGPELVWPTPEMRPGLSLTRTGWLWMRRRPRRAADLTMAAAEGLCTARPPVPSLLGRASKKFLRGGVVHGDGERQCRARW